MGWRGLRVSCPPEGRGGSMPMSAQCREEEYKSAVTWVGGVGRVGEDGVCLGVHFSTHLFDRELCVIAV